MTKLNIYKEDVSQRLWNLLLEDVGIYDSDTDLGKDEHLVLDVEKFEIVKA